MRASKITAVRFASKTELEQLTVWCMQAEFGWVGYWRGRDRESRETGGVWRSSSENDEAARARLGHCRSRLVRIVEKRGRA